MKSKIIYIFFVSLFLIIFHVFSWQLIDIPIKDDLNYRIVNYNLKYAEDSSDEFVLRKNTITDMLKSYDADIIVLQEANYEWMNLESGLPVLLDDYTFVGVGREDGIDQGEYAPIFYLTNKFELLDYNTIWLSETPDKVSIGWDASTYRIMTTATLKNLENGEIFTVNNTHLDHLGKKAVNESIELILQEVISSKYPYLLTGDFNFPSFYPQYFKVTEVLDDTKNIAESSMKHGTINYSSNNKLLQFIRIDYVFVSENDFDVINYRVDPSVKYLDKPISDHFPIIVDYKFK